MRDIICLHAWHYMSSCVTYFIRDKFFMRHIVSWASCATCLHAWHVFIRDKYMKFKVFPPAIPLYKLTSKISIFTSLHLFLLPSPSFFLPTIIISSLKVMTNLHLHIFYNYFIYYSLTFFTLLTNVLSLLYELC